MRSDIHCRYCHRKLKWMEACDCGDGAMTALDAFLAEWRAKSAAATAGPWSAVSSLPVYAVTALREVIGPRDVVTASGREYARLASGQKHGSLQGDAEFIAHARNNGDRLVQMVDAAREFIEAATCNCAPPTFRCGKHRFLDRLDRLAASEGGG